ncbi:ZT dimer domain-containing protein [Citrus sinensis]|uniref:ZT dimer domain-containing protein n=1 Tax=Citrus sinensis TaxID=2711 RepID=A0ACB8IRY5_CITSI|nr:ZT dimer domain-containing protein [Citrus sinensis]
MSGSIAIAASTLDSLLDLLVGGILWCTHWTVKNVNIYKYPIGKLRVQPVGIIIFAAVMSTLVFQVLIEAVQELGKDEEPTKMSTIQLAWLYSIMIGATLVKLGLWICCRSSGNTIGPCMRQGLVVAVRGDKYFWWIDPPDAILLAVCTIKNWSETVWENAGAYLPNSSQPSTMIA